MYTAYTYSIPTYRLQTWGSSGKDWSRDDDDPDHRTFLFSMTREWTKRKDSIKGVD